MKPLDALNDGSFSIKKNPQNLELVNLKCVTYAQLFLCPQRSRPTCTPNQKLACFVLSQNHQHISMCIL